MRNKNRKRNGKKLSEEGIVTEVIALCPTCKALQPIQLTNDGLMQTRKFTQEGKNIYHDCGSHQPCRLFV